MWFCESRLSLYDFIVQSFLLNSQPSKKLMNTRLCRGGYITVLTLFMETCFIVFCVGRTLDIHADWDMCTVQRILNHPNNGMQTFQRLRFTSVCLYRDEQAPLFSLCTQLSSGGAVAPGTRWIWELQTRRIPLETWPSKGHSVLKDTSVLNSQH